MQTNTAAEPALPRSQEFYRTLIESMESVIAMVDVNGRFLYMNDVAASSLGASPEQLQGKTMAELFPPEVAARQLANIRKVIQEEKGSVFENPSSLNGERHWFRTSIQPVHDDTGAVVAALINSSSIHELKTTQQALQELNRSLEARVAERTAEVQDLYDNAPVGYHTLDANRCFAQINQTELNWLGYTREELIGRPAVEIIAPAGREEYEAAFEWLLQIGYARDVMVEVVRKDGSHLSVLAHGLVIYQEDGSVDSVRTTLVDATERKRAIDATQRAMQELARSLRLRDEFLANMSHELRTPLNSILTLSEVLAADIYGPLSERQRSAIGVIETSGRHLLALINDVLDLSKIEAEQLTLNVEPVIVNDICLASMAFVKELAQKKRIKLAYHIAQRELVIHADARRLKQMVVNLLTNAVKFTPEDGGIVELTVALDEDRSEVRIAVRDNGIGIAAADLPKLFQPFMQLDSGLNCKHEGTGLGLALVKNLAAQHSGTVTVESAGVPGQGSCFTIVLPYAAD